MSGLDQPRSLESRNPIVAEYGRLLRGRWWQQIERAPTFCDFYASKRG